ncbi:MAG TPA: low temperature requirement protein A, partial [Longimicrobium sp.]|nr:low temperature requirement protein A [Longimicrobium sp.]
MPHASATDIHWGEEADPAQAGPRVSTLELFFDLVFVYTLTQLTELLAHELSVAGFVRVLLIFGVSWWMYGGYAWLTNHLPLDRPARRVTLLLAMAAFLVQALAIPRAFDGSGLAFGVGYLAVVLVHASLFWQATRAIGATAAFNVGSALLVIVAGFTHGWLDYVFWMAALAVQVATPFLIRLEAFRIRPAHFVERHGLLMIVALGESVVAIGIGARELAIDAGLVTAVVLGVALVACLWWTYFGGDDALAEHALSNTSVEARAGMAIHAFFYAHIPMLLGVVCIAVGVKKALAHPTDPLALAPAIALGGGTALYMLGDVL